jgi:hypothetical protein
MDTLGLFEILLPLIWGGVAVWELQRSLRAGRAHLFRIEYARDGDKPAFWAVTLVWVAVACIAFAAFGEALWLASHPQAHPSDGAVFFLIFFEALLAAAGAGVILLRIVPALRRGEARSWFGGPAVERRRSPARYWLMTTADIGVFALLTVQAVLLGIAPEAYGLTATHRS